MADHRGDLLAKDKYGTLYYCPGTGKGVFGKAKLLGGGMNELDSLMSVGDLNGDGKTDLLGVSNDSFGTPTNCCWPGRLVLYPGKGNGTFGADAMWSGDWWGLGNLF